MELPQKCEWIDEMIFTDLDEEAARTKVKAYNEEANKKGYFRRWQNDRSNIIPIIKYSYCIQINFFEGVQQKNFRPGDRRGGFAGSRFERFQPTRGGFNRPAPYSVRRDLRPARPAHINPWRHHPRGNPNFHLVIIKTLVKFILLILFLNNLFLWR